MSDEKISEDELEFTFGIFNLRITLCIMFCFNFLIQSKVFYYPPDDPTPVFLWTTGLITVFPAIIMMIANLHTLFQISRLKKGQEAEKKYVP
ncbi:MAG: hypothetical protein CVV03_10280 [Firmicutes bacterium HGW-Firmicutes-8]|nr:MAG: hypothetical protein CVV03_10280 [Firmicutes bacterium HGW-Firmicutes-8]